MDTSRGSQRMLWTSSQQVASVLQAMAEVRHAEAVRIGKLIAALRERKQWSQEELAHEVGVSTSTISRWERGLHKGYGPNIRKLADALEVEPAMLTPADDLLVGSQLDRIESKLGLILAAMGIEEREGPSSEEMAGVLEAGGREVQRAIVQRPPKGSGRQGKKPAAGRRSRA